MTNTVKSLLYFIEINYLILLILLHTKLLSCTWFSEEKLQCIPIFNIMLIIIKTFFLKIKRKM